MPLALTDPRWEDLRSSYGDTKDTVAILTQAYQEGLSSESLGNLVNEVQHQGDTSSAMYAVAPHLVELAQRRPDEALDLLTFAGLIYSDATKPGAVPCPEFLENDFTEFAKQGARLLCPLLITNIDFHQYKWAVTALSGFLGHQNFAQFLEQLDYHDGQFTHGVLDKPE